MKKSLMWFLLIFFLVSSFAVVAQGELDYVAATFGDLNLADIYERHPKFFDFLVFATIFIAISVYSLGKAFPDRTGKILGVVIGIALTIAFLTFEYTRQFTIKDFGPIAGLVILVLMGIVVYKFVKMAKVGGVYAALLGVVVAFSVMEAIVPDVFDWVKQQGGFFLLVYSFVKLAVWVCIIVLIWKGGASLFGVIKGTPGVKEAAAAVKKGAAKRKKGKDDEEEGEETPEEKVEEKREKTEKGLEKRLSRALRRVYRYNKKVKKDLEKAHKESLKGKGADREKIKKDLEEAKKYEGKEIDFDALVNDVVNELRKIASAEPSLKERLYALNNLLRLKLRKIKEQIEKAEKAKNIFNLAAILVGARNASEKIEEEIRGLEAVVEGMEKELEKKEEKQTEKKAEKQAKKKVEKQAAKKAARRPQVRY